MIKLPDRFFLCFFQCHVKQNTKDLLSVPGLSLTNTFKAPFHFGFIYYDFKLTASK